MYSQKNNKEGKEEKTRNRLKTRLIILVILYSTTIITTKDVNEASNIICGKQQKQNKTITLYLNIMTNTHSYMNI